VAGLVMNDEDDGVCQSDHELVVTNLKLVDTGPWLS